MGKLGIGKLGMDMDDVTRKAEEVIARLPHGAGAHRVELLDDLTRAIRDTERVAEEMPRAASDATEVLSLLAGLVHWQLLQVLAYEQTRGIGLILFTRLGRFLYNDARDMYDLAYGMYEDLPLTIGTGEPYMEALLEFRGISTGFQPVKPLLGKPVPLVMPLVGKHEAPTILRPKRRPHIGNEDLHGLLVGYMFACSQVSDRLPNRIPPEQWVSVTKSFGEVFAQCARQQVRGNKELCDWLKEFAKQSHERLVAGVTRRTPEECAGFVEACRELVAKASDRREARVIAATACAVPDYVNACHAIDLEAPRDGHLTRRLQRACVCLNQACDEHRMPHVAPDVPAPEETGGRSQEAMEAVIDFAARVTLCAFGHADACGDRQAFDLLEVAKDLLDETGAAVYDVDAFEEMVTPA